MSLLSSRLRPASNIGWFRLPVEERTSDSMALRLLGLFPAEDDGAGSREPATGAVHAGQCGVAGNLTGARLPTELLDRFDEEEHPPHTRLTGRKSTTVGVGRQCAVDS